jgi:uncharacterized RDD family membrane protein YckC
MQPNFIYPNATRLKLLAACMYELLLLLALWMLCTWIFVGVFGDATSGYKRYLLQLVLWLCTGAYFVWCWCKSGQTLATQTWKIKLVTQDSANQQNNTLSPKQALIRYALASACLLACGLGYFWALIDKDGLFLHDRLLKTRFMQLQ